MGAERGQASIEWIGVVLCVALGPAALAPGRRRRRALVRRLAGATRSCARSRGGCDEGRDALRAAYGERDAELVRRFAPEHRLRAAAPTRCRSTSATAARTAARTRPTTATSTRHRSTRGGARATAFTHVVAPRRRDLHPVLALLPRLDDHGRERGGRLGGWLAASRAGAPPATRATTPDDWECVPGAHRPRRPRRVRASSHHGYQWCKQRRCRNTWGPWTGWTRVSRGSHAGHIPTELGAARRPRPHDRPDPRRARRSPASTPRANDHGAGLRSSRSSRSTRPLQPAGRRHHAAVAEGGLHRPAERLDVVADAPSAAWPRRPHQHLVHRHVLRLRDRVEDRVGDVLGRRGSRRSARASSRSPATTTGFSLWPWSSVSTQPGSMIVTRISASQPVSCRSASENRPRPTWSGCRRRDPRDAMPARRPRRCSRCRRRRPRACSGSAACVQ